MSSKTYTHVFSRKTMRAVYRDPGRCPFVLDASVSGACRGAHKHDGTHLVGHDRMQSIGVRSQWKGGRRNIHRPGTLRFESKVRTSSVAREVLNFTCEHAELSSSPNTSGLGSTDGGIERCRWGGIESLTSARRGCAAPAGDPWAGWSRASRAQRTSSCPRRERRGTLHWPLGAQ